MRGVRLLLAVAFVLAALLSVVNVSAYKTATVTSSSTMTVSTTNTAAVALVRPTTGNGQNQTSVSAGGILTVDFRKGFTSGPFGFQPLRSGGSVAGDIFKMGNVFTLQNLSTGSQCHDVSVYVKGTPPPDLAEIRGRPPSQALTNAGTGTTQFWTTAGQTVNRRKLGTSAATTQIYIDFWWDAGATSEPGAAADTFTIEVSSTKSAACP